jgi:hypothetical protein
MFLRLLHYTTLLLRPEEDYVTGKTPKKLVQVVQELHATVDIYCPKNHLEIEEFHLQEDWGSNPNFQN